MNKVKEKKKWEVKVLPMVETERISVMDTEEITVTRQNKVDTKQINVKKWEVD